MPKVPPTSTVATNEDGLDNQRPKCGLIMPISKSATHSAEHWADVQSLLHRAIATAGFEPENVWEGDLTDRISKRIVGNIFAYEIVVVDASDLNPNVMLELGLRLASKRPTVVVTDNIGELPFDIRDLRALPYPSDLNILGMEKFFSDLNRALTVKFAAYQSGEYEPFLSDVVVEVVNPETREVSLDSAVLERLDEINRRVSRIEMGGRTTVPVPPTVEGDLKRRFAFTIPSEGRQTFVNFLVERGYGYKTFDDDEGMTHILVSGVGQGPAEGIALRNRVKSLRGSIGVPEEVLSKLTSDR